MDIFKKLPLEKQAYLETIFQNCSEEVRYYMRLTEAEAEQTLIRAGEKCTNIYIILTGKVTGIEWPMYGHAYPFKDYGAGDFFGEIECFAGLSSYRISVVTITKCEVLIIPAVFYMDWIQTDVDALYLRTQENMRRLITQTADARRYLFVEAKERLMLYLIRKYKQKMPASKTLVLKSGRDQMSDEIGISVRTLNRSIKKLEECGLIQLQKGKVLITEEGFSQMQKDIEDYLNGYTKAKRSKQPNQKEEQICMQEKK